MKIGSDRACDTSYSTIRIRGVGLSGMTNAPAHAATNFNAFVTPRTGPFRYPFPALLARFGGLFLVSKTRIEDERGGLAFTTIRRVRNRTVTLTAMPRKNDFPDGYEQLLTDRYNPN